MTPTRLSVTRRAVLASSAAGTAALALRTVAAQTGTPAAGSDDEIELLFVQAAGSGNLTPSDQGYTLSFGHDSGQTIFFSDRPERLTGLLPTSELVAQWPFQDESPPNAALAISNGEDVSAQVFIGVLSNPTWDPATGTLSYGFWVLADDIPAATPAPVPESFGSATLFIDGTAASEESRSGIIVVNLSGQPIRVGIDKRAP